MFHHNWVRTTGRVLDARIREIWHDRTGLGDTALTLHNYVVEFAALNGQTTRLEVEQRDTVDVNIGDDVHLLVSPDGTKAIFAEKDPRINVIAVGQAQEAADAERFRQQLNDA